NRIFAQVKKDPSSADELHKLMNYYLPTTKKLLNAYVELDKQPEVGENITQTKKEIDEAMDTINMAFESLLDSLFQDMAWDISSDISVMKTMMAQDGLTVEGQGITAQTGAVAQSVVGQAAAQSLEFGGQAQAQTQPK
ncbi:MAG: 5-bromo-4-chloroindolyl phosphate hydrolysis family protein, partial [Butyrivibrio sp.]|nr:5-bromo-4-chloroindolyl phosphate hydrolysis family protein [Butyrivibrio sp.]